MEQTLQSLIALLNLGGLWSAFLLVAVFYIYKKEPFKIFMHFDEQKSKDLEFASSLLLGPALTDESKALVREHLERTLFQKYYKINTCEEMRSALLKFRNRHRSQIDWQDLRLAFPYMPPSTGSINIKITLLDRILRWVVSIVSVFMVVYTTFVILVAVLGWGTGRSSNAQFILLTALALIFLAISMAFLRLNLPYKSALKVLALLEEARATTRGCSPVKKAGENELVCEDS